MHRSRRPIEPESVLGQSKSNKGYNRFRHFDKEKPEKVMMDFATFALAFNVFKLHRKSKNKEKNPSQSQKKSCIYAFLSFLYHRPINVQNFKILLEKT